jgi:HlyD family secretion protein
MNRKYVFILVLAAAAVLLAYMFLSPNGEGTKEPAKVERKRYIKSVYASGYVDSVNKVQIKPEVSGYIDRIYVKEGDKVKKGEVIATIKNDKLKEQLRDSPFLKALRDEISIWKMNTEIERRNFERRESLFEKGIISKEDYDKSRQSLEVTEKTLAKSLEALNDQLASLRSELDSLTASEQAVVRETEKHEIKSPVDGEVLRKFAEEGNYVNSVLKDDILFSLGNPGTLETVLSVDEEFVPLIKPGDRVLITTDAYPGKVFEGKIRVIERESDRVSRTVKVKADTDYPPDIPVGITVEANIVVADREGLFISKEAYKDGYIEVVKDGKKVKVPVEAGVEEDDYIEIKDGAPGGGETLTR